MKMAKLSSALLVFVLSSGLFAAPKAPLPKRIKLEKYKRGYTVYTPPGLQDGERCPALIWLHPLGSSMNTRFRRDWWSGLKKRKFFMVLPESADRRAWTDADMPYLLALATDLPRKFAIDRRKLVLFGCQAGGQMGFHLARRSHRRFCSLITMAAYPVSGMKEPALSLPSRRARKTLSILMIVGTADNGRMFCRQAAEQLEAQGFAVGLIEIPKTSKIYMPTVRPRVLSWLEKVAANERPSVELSEEERNAREELAEASRNMLGEILKGTHKPAPTRAPPTVAMKFTEAGLSIRIPTGWKVLADESASARLTTVASHSGPLLVQLARGKNKKGLDEAIEAHEARNRTRGVRYRTVGDGEFMMLNEQSWRFQQATCMSYHRRHVAGGKTKVVDAPSMLTVCYQPLNDKGTEYLRVVFLYTNSTAGKIDLPGLVRTVLSSVRVLPKSKKEGP